MAGMDPQKTKAFLAARGAPVPAEAMPDPVAQLPTLVQIVYTPPNPDKTRKACSNCVQYATAARQCYIHHPEQVIQPAQVCNYHVWTPSPMPTFPRRLPILPLTPEQSGLVSVPGGTSCDICLAYSAIDMDFGVCSAARDENIVPAVNATVETLGCCAKWTPKR